MAKRKVAAGLIGVPSGGGNPSKPLCAAIPYWIKGSTEHLTPRLCCTKKVNHKDKRHQDGRGHQWDVNARPR